jgi:SAM-dependent methyltransferase
VSTQQAQVPAQESEHERIQADEKYNQALTALDLAVSRTPDVPGPPPPPDVARMADLESLWNVRERKRAGGGVKDLVRRVLLKVIGPALGPQVDFNAALVDHLHRNLAVERETRDAMVKLTDAVRHQVAALSAFQHQLILFAQTITAYVDTKDRAWGGQDVVNAAFDALADDWLKRWESLSAREQRFVDRVASVDDLRATAALAQQTTLALKRDVERLLESRAGVPVASGVPVVPVVPDVPVVPVVPDLNAFKYLGFEDAFRGSRDEIRARLAEYVPRFAGRSAVLDIGCGRGEFLDLLRAAGVGARGVDVNQAMVETARSRGLDAVEGDALSFVRGLPDASLDGVFSAQVVEHLDPSYLMALLEALFHKLRPGGVIALETINPACWVAFFESYIRDITHVRALHPETLQYLMRVSGFQSVEIELRSPVKESDKLRTIAARTIESEPLLAALVDTFNENTAKLNARMFTYQDYAAIGRR